jgi:phage protein D
MQREQVAVEIDGTEVRDLYPDLSRVEVELDEELAAMFRLELTVRMEPDGSLRHVDDKRLTPWRKVAVHAGFADGTEPLMTGYLTHVHLVLDRDPADWRLELWGMDGTALMNREEQLRDWPGKKDSDIATTILRDHGFTPKVEDTRIVHDVKVSTIVQRETDMQFLRRLALRNGYECFVEDTTAYFQPPQIEADPQPVLAVQFGTETNVDWFTVQVNALSETDVGMFQLHRNDKSVLSSLVQSSLEPALAAKRSVDLLPPTLRAARSFVGMNATTGEPEMKALCQSLFHRGAWFVTGEGVVDGNAYGHVLRPRRPVTIKGVGETYSGVYYVTHVTHSIDLDGYRQRFLVKRNGLEPKGTEDFESDGGPLGAL